MAVNSGVGSHFAFISVDGQQFPLERGRVSQNATRRSSSFSGALPLSYPGAESAFAGLGDNIAVITVITRGTSAPLVTGEVDLVNFDYIKREIHFTGRDKSAKLHQNKTAEKFLNKTPSSIVQDLTGRVGMPCSIQEGGTLLAGLKLQQDYVRLSDNVSFAYVIHKLAEFDGARWYVDGSGTFHYIVGSNSAGTYTINYQPPGPGYITSDAMELRIARNVQAGKSVNVQVKSWHPKKKQMFQGYTNIPGRGGPLQYNYDLPGLLQDHVNQHSLAMANERARHEIKVTASVVGDPTVYAGMGLQLNGTNYWDQTYDIDTVEHEIGMTGHRTHITALATVNGRSATTSTGASSTEALAVANGTAPAL
jgi:hypothetical protein